MRISWPILSNFGLFLTTATILASLQCSLWLQFLGYFPAPQLWLVILIYWTIFRSFTVGLLMVYLLTFLASSLSNIPTSLLLVINLSIFLFVTAIKSRFFWVGPTYLTIVSLVATLSFPLLHFFYSWTFEINSIIDIEVLDWILSSLLTALFSLPLYQLLQWIDKKTQMELPTETGASTYE